MADNSAAGVGDPASNQNPNIASPSIDPPINAAVAFDYASNHLQSNLPISASLPRIAQIQHKYGAAAAASAMRQHTGMYSNQMSFASPHQQQQQQQQGPGVPMSRSGMMGQGQTSPSATAAAAAAAHFNLQSQMLTQRQKMSLVAQQLHPSSSTGQTLQGVHSLAMIGNGIGLNAQVRGNGSLGYGQQRLIPGQLRQQASAHQTQLTSSSQKLPGQTVPRQLSLSAMNPQLSGLTHNGQSALVQGTLSTQQWLKPMQPAMPASVSPSYHVQQQRQQQAFLQQQLSSSQLHSKSMGTNHQQIQLVQQQPPPQMAAQQHQPQRQPLSIHQQQQQQELSPRMPVPAIQNSISMTGSQPGTPASAGTTGGTSSQGTEASNQLLGKRKINDLVAQVDALGKLDPEVQDLLLEMADHFIDSVTSFACSIAKHRKSSTLESKDVLLHLEKNWQLTIPGYTREENKYQRNCVPKLASQQSERDRSAAKGTTRQTLNDSAVDRSVKPSPSPEQLPVPVTASQTLQKVMRL